MNTTIKFFREKFIELSEEYNEYLALKKLFAETPAKFRRWVDSDEEWLFDHDVACIKKSGRVVAVYPMKDGTIAGYIVFLRKFSGGVCTSCGEILPRRKLTDMEQKYIKDRSPHYDGVQLQKDVNDAREYAGEYWCEDCINFYWDSFDEDEMW